METSRRHKTAQEAFWAGDFGEEYIHRNQGDTLLASNIAFFVKALRSAIGVSTCIEFGSNIGMNIRALKLLYPEIEAHAIEINTRAAEQLSQVIPESQVYNTSVLEFSPSRQWDLALVKGVLIHINPDELLSLYDKLVMCTSKYLLVAEYYNPVPVAIPYRGHSDRLFKRDFAGEIMDTHPEMKLLDYGFVYRRDPVFPQDDITWFLLEKSIR